MRIYKRIAMAGVGAEKYLVGRQNVLASFICRCIFIQLLVMRKASKPVWVDCL